MANDNGAEHNVWPAGKRNACSFTFLCECAMCVCVHSSGGGDASRIYTIIIWHWLCLWTAEGLIGLLLALACLQMLSLPPVPPSPCPCCRRTAVRSHLCYYHNECNVCARTSATYACNVVIGSGTSSPRLIFDGDVRWRVATNETHTHTSRCDLPLRQCTAYLP